SRDAAVQVRDQDVVLAADGTPTLRRGVSRDRRSSLEDHQIRHGRKSRAVRVDGYKWHVLHDLASGLVCAVGLTAANAPEASRPRALPPDLAPRGLGGGDLAELHIAGAYLNSPCVRARPATLAIYCKAWPVRNRAGRFPKTAFTLDGECHTIRCPHEV